jgi:cytochrome c-type biogenesis protein CcmH
LALFWLIVAGLVAFALAMTLPALLGRRGRHRGAPHAVANAAVHRARLDELEQALARGELSAEQHRVEVEELMRRVLSEHRDERSSARGASFGAAVLTALALPALAFVIYLQVGNPAAVTGDPAQQLATLAALEQRVQAKPGDARAWVLLARRLAGEERFLQAVEAYARSLAASEQVARDPQVWCELADALGMAQGGSLQGRPRQAIEQALGLDPTRACALELAGSAAVEASDYAAARRYWENLARQLAADSPERAPLERALQRVRVLEREQIGQGIRPREQGWP